MAAATIVGADGRPRLHRHYLLGTGKTFGIFLHHFVDSDDRDELNDHPWRGGRPAWTLLVHGPKVRRWGFLDLATGGFRFWAPPSVKPRGAGL